MKVKLKVNTNLQGDKQLQIQILLQLLSAYVFLYWLTITYPTSRTDGDAEVQCGLLVVDSAHCTASEALN